MNSDLLFSDLLLNKNGTLVIFMSFVLILKCFILVFLKILETAEHILGLKFKQMMT